MNKAELLDRIVKESQINKSQVELVFNKTLEIISKTVSKGEEVKLVGFGTFDRTTRKERVGRNPKTGGRIQIPSTKVPRFRPGKEFKGLITGN